MAGRIYSYEVLAEKARSGANVVYRVRSQDGQEIDLFEWTPAEPADAKKKFAEVASEPGPAEMFTTGGKLYFAAENAEIARAMLDRLRRAQVFTGDWPGLTSGPPPPQPAKPAPAPPPPSPVLQPRSAPASNNSTLPWVALFLVILAAGGVWVYVEESNRREVEQAREAARQEQSRREAAEVKQREEEAARADETKGLRRTIDERESELAKRVSDDYWEQQKSAVDGLRGRHHRLILSNECTSEINVAIHYTSVGGKIATAGWWRVAPGQTVRPSAHSPEPGYFFYAYAVGSDPPLHVWDGQGQSGSRDIMVVSALFVHQAGGELYGPDKRKVTAFAQDFGTEFGEHVVRFPCQSESK